MLAVWEFLKDWLRRIRSVSTPFGGLSWDPPATQNQSDEPPIAGLSESESEEPEDDLSDLELEILVAIGSAEDQCLELEEISQSVRLSEVRTRHHLDLLEERDLVAHSEDPMYGYVYSLTAAGRRFVVEADLVE